MEEEEDEDMYVVHFRDYQNEKERETEVVTDSSESKGWCFTGHRKPGSEGGERGERQQERNMIKEAKGVSLERGWKKAKKMRSLLLDICDKHKNWVLVDFYFYLQKS